LAGFTQKAINVPVRCSLRLVDSVRHRVCPMATLDSDAVIHNAFHPRPNADYQLVDGLRRAEAIPNGSVRAVERYCGR
jgi:hypothetical protein